MYRLSVVNFRLCFVNEIKNHVYVMMLCASFVFFLTCLPPSSERSDRGAARKMALKCLLYMLADIKDTIDYGTFINMRYECYIT